MARHNRWDDLSIHLTDEVMNQVVPQGTYDQISDILTEWYSGLCNGLSLPVPADDTHDTQLTELVHRCKRIPTSRQAALW